jgi:hypothetical protein
MKDKPLNYKFQKRSSLTNIEAKVSRNIANILFYDYIIY